MVVDHDTKRLFWAAEGRDEKTLDRFFFELGQERCKLISQVSAAAGNWIAPLVALRCPNAVRCMDPVHVIAWALTPSIRSDARSGTPPGAGATSSVQSISSRPAGHSGRGLRTSSTSSAPDWAGWRRPTFL